ncbi:hypothetical protein THASP1DRAFT_16268, partial [Thamnocephalis sphaerospora]
RQSKTSQKMALFPEGDNEYPSLGEAEVYDQISQLPQGVTKVDGEQVHRLDRSSLSRVTAYCTAALYTPYRLATPIGSTTPEVASPTNGASVGISELFVFDYGVVVFWGFTQAEEASLLRYLAAFEDERLPPEDLETEEFHFYYNKDCQPRIYNDIISLRSATNYMAKLTISHAVAQSTKLALFEGLVDDTIDSSKHIPREMARTGKSNMSRTAISKKIGQLFIMRINVNLVSNVLDTPEIFWSEPSLQPLYNAIKGYLEISQRVDLLNQRVTVISDMLDMLREHLNSCHGEHLEWIIIYLIALEIVIGLITVSFDLFGLHGILSPRG